MLVPGEEGWSAGGTEARTPDPSSFTNSRPCHPPRDLGQGTTLEFLEYPLASGSWCGHWAKLCFLRVRLPGGTSDSLKTHSCLFHQIFHGPLMVLMVDTV
jgi:hypothetical protein